MELCRRIHDAVKGCPLVLLCATWREAAPVVEAMTIETDLTVATKRVLVGTLSEGAARGASPDPRMVLAITGCDKANTAHTLTCLLQAMDPSPRLVMQTGIAGAFVGAGAGPGAGPREQARTGDLVLATEEVYSDTGSTSPGGWISAEELGLPIATVDDLELAGRFVLDVGLVDQAAEVLAVAIEAAEGPPLGRRRLVRGPFVTSSCVTGMRTDAGRIQARWGAVAESMEGAAAAHICALYGVPFLEARAISNMVVDRDRGSWVVDEAVAVAGAAAVALIRGAARLCECLDGGGERYAGA